MKNHLKPVSYALIGALVFSVALSTPNVGPLSVDVVSAATGEAPAPAPAPAPKPTAPKAPTASKPAAPGERLLAFGSYGDDVKLIQTALNNNGYKLKVDGIFGKNTEEAVKSYQGKVGLKADGIVGPKTLAKLNPVDLPAAPAVTDGKVSVKLGKVEYAAHGTKCFTVAIVAMAGDKIADALLDDYQVTAPEGYTGVPNSDADFGKSFADGKILVSKRANAATYSANMVAKAGATVPVDKSLDAIQAYVTGKTVAELEATLGKTSPEQMVDAVSGATLVDTYGYVSAIVEAAKAAKEIARVDAAVANSIELGKVEYAAHGTKCFTIAAAVMTDGKIVGALLDDYQVTAPEGYTGVPNSDADFGKTIADGKILVSKRANAATYSANMVAKAGATVPVDKSLDAIQAYVAGKTVAELEATLGKTSPEQMVDAVSGATLVDTYGYVSAIVEAAKTTAPVEVDAVSTASIVNDAAALEKALSKDGNWIACTLRDIVTDKDLVIEGEFHDKNLPEKALKRKLGLYTQDDAHNVTARFTLTAPSLTIKSPNTTLQHGTFVGDIYVRAAGFNLTDNVVKGNIYFVTQEAKDTFTMDEKSSVTGSKILADVDAVSTASIVNDADALAKALSKDGNWIACTLRDITTDKALVMEGEFHDKNLPEKALKRKLGIYTHNDPSDSKIVTHRFTLTAPSLTVKSPNGTLQHGIFVGDIYVEANGFNLTDQAVVGNIYFATQEAKDTFTMDDASSVSGVMEVK